MLVFVALFVVGKTDAQQSFKAIPVTLKVDTIRAKYHKILSHSFHFGKDLIRVDAYYQFSKTNPDFSFYYPQLLDSVQVSIDGKPAPCLRKNLLPSMHHYLIDFDSVIVKQEANSKSYLIFGKPFFCNGHYCSSISVLVVTVSSSKTESFEVDTEYWSSDDLLADIHSHYDSKKQWAIPVKKDNDSKTPIRWVQF